MMRTHHRIRPALGLLLALSLAQPGCARNPVTGAMQLALISEAQEIQMGEQAAREVAASIGLVDDPALQGYMDEIGQRLAAVSERPHLPWTFGVVDDPTPNAFALPGGFIYFTRGMMSLMSSEAQLASVLGHEIGHVTARHHVTRLSRAQLAQIGLGVGGILFPELAQLGGLAGAGLDLLFLSYSRDAERQADDLGFRYALTESYDVREMADVFISLQRLGEADQQSPLPGWLLTHPLPDERIAAVEARAAELEPGPTPRRIGASAYLQRIDGLVYGANPRNGFFRDALYQHPELRFRITFPSGWRTQNLRQAVMGASPAGDAAVQLTLSGDPSPEAAADRFLRQQGVRPGPASRQTINGLPAVVANFQAQTQQQLLQGVATFIAYENRIYQILAYSAAPVFFQHERVLRQTGASFAPLTDPAVLGIQPNRIRVVQTSESMTLAEFHRRYPSAIPIEELAVLNQVAGPQSMVPAGSLVKRIAQ
jgi:predicted Zn-dependent protease